MDWCYCAIIVAQSAGRNFREAARFSACDTHAHFLLCLTSTINHADLRLEIRLASLDSHRILERRPSVRLSIRPSICSVPFEPVPFLFFFSDGHSAAGSGREEHPGEGEEGVGEEVGESGTSRSFPSIPFRSLPFPSFPFKIPTIIRANSSIKLFFFN